MRIVKKSLIRRLFISLFIFSLVIAGLGAYFYYFKDDNVPYIFLISSLFLFLVLFLLVYWFDIIRPLKKIVVEMQSLLTGNEYKKIYSTRIDEIGVLSYFFNRVIHSLGKVSFDIKDRKRMLEELNIAAQLQRDILPLKNPSIPGIQIVAKNRSASEVGGDSFNILVVGHKTYVYIGDVTGHGVAAGLIMTMVSSLVSVFGELKDNAYDIIVNVNKYIKKHVKKAMFMTMVMLCWDDNLKKMTFVGAGHEHILVYRMATGECETILSGGVALGMVPDNSKLIKEQEIFLNDGDVIILYTDGITEARNNAGELYTIENLKRAIKAYAPEYSAEGINYHIAKDVSTFMQEHVQEDDMTLIVLKRDMTGKFTAEDVKNTSWEV